MGIGIVTETDIFEPKNYDDGLFRNRVSENDILSSSLASIRRILCLTLQLYISGVHNFPSNSTIIRIVFEREKMWETGER